MGPLTVPALVALLADAVSYADAIRIDAARGGAELVGDELAEARAAIARHEAERAAVWRVTVRRPAGGYAVWHLRGSLFEVIECNDRSDRTAGEKDRIVSIDRESEG